MSAPTLKERLQYAFDNVMARGTSALIGLLGGFTFLFLAATAIVLTAFGLSAEEAEPLGLVDAFWFGLMHAMDAGALGGDAGGWPFKLVMLIVTLMGIFVLSILIGLLTAGVEGRIEDLRKGRSRVIEEGHTLVLGWSPRVITILTELAIANESRGGAAIVVLGEAEKADMEDAIRDRVTDLRGSRAVCRSGSMTDLGDLAMVGVDSARSILVCPPEGDPDPDITVLKTLLAITNAPNRRKAPYHIVAVMEDPANVEAARLVGKDEVEVVLAGDLISRITVQTCRQTGLSVVHTELLDFGGDEIYFKEEPSLVGKTFGDALFAFAKSAPLGLVRATGSVLVHPPFDTRIAAGDRVIVIAEDDDKIALASSATPVDEAAIRSGTPTPLRPERTLVLGWNWRAPRMVQGLDGYVADGSYCLIVCDLDEAEVREACGTLDHQALEVRKGDTTSRRLLDDLGVEDFDHIILLCSDTLEAQKADSRVLVSLLHLRDMQEKLGQDFSIVTEMLDVRNRELAEVTRADDFIVSDRLVSLMMTQVSEQKLLARVFENLFDPAGSEIYLKPAADYVAETEVPFATVVEAARRRGEIALGYRLVAAERDASRAYGVVVNPALNARLTLTSADRVIVLAES